MNLNAYINHQFDRGFLLRDEDLTKLLDFVKVRASEVNASDRLKIKVYRLDSLVYESPDLEPLRAEENAVRNRLTRVQVLVDHADLKVNFDFDAEENVSIAIESIDRDRAYLLFSELKEYLNTEVLVLRKRASKDDRLLWMMIPMMALMCFLALAAWWPLRGAVSEDHLRLLMKSDDIQGKLNYLIDEAVKRSETKLMLWFLPTSVLIPLAHPFLSWLQNHWYPRNLFYFGKEKQRYDSLIQRRSRWVWGVVVGLIISFLGSFAVWFLPTH